MTMCLFSREINYHYRYYDYDCMDQEGEVGEHELSRIRISHVLEC